MSATPSPQPQQSTNIALPTLPFQVVQMERRMDVSFLYSQMFESLLAMIDRIDPGKKKRKYLVVSEPLHLLIYGLIDPQPFQERQLGYYRLDKSKLSQFKDADPAVLIFLLRPCTEDIDLMGSVISGYDGRRVDKEYHAMFYPELTFIVNNNLKNGIHYKHLEKKVYNMNFDLIPLGTDLLSLEYQPSLEELFITKEFGCHNAAAESLYRLEAMFGKFKSVYIKGTNPKSNPRAKR